MDRALYRGWRLMIAAVPLAFALGQAPMASATRIAGCTRALPVVAHRAGGAIVTLPAEAQPPAACASETGYATSESSIAVTRDGTLVYSPAESENSMARSSTGGANWSLTAPAVAQHTDFWNTVDPDVIAD